ncbi:hypothetical protein KIH39_00785 [Telmatocola sphagniphila]|uniref:Uncharacterized protein n=1 Tax=Telmatocola sphagniphila TaxID=1123043 RepID=A0A8E6EVA9_9BACT|nr:hypothetical protein [Telmatocola sphagniphila]QVL32485.1 hypothetical protein KIH39_00785 [Telmatocola sphagniphila]
MNPEKLNPEIESHLASKGSLELTYGLKKLQIAEIFGFIALGSSIMSVSLPLMNATLREG